MKRLLRWSPLLLAVPALMIYRARPSGRPHFARQVAVKASVEVSAGHQRSFQELERRAAPERELGLMAFLGMNQPEVAERLLSWMHRDPSPRVRARAAFLLVDVLEELPIAHQEAAKAWAREALASPHACMVIEAYDLLASAGMTEADGRAIANSALASGDPELVWNAIRSLATSGSGADHVGPLLDDLQRRPTTDPHTRAAIEEIRTTLSLP
mgnify:FL=1